MDDKAALIMGLDSLIRDAERRIGSFIASGGSQDDKYVQEQIAKIKAWAEALAKEKSPQPGDSNNHY